MITVCGAVYYVDTIIGTEYMKNVVGKMIDQAACLIGEVAKYHIAKIVQTRKINLSYHDIVHMSHAIVLLCSTPVMIVVSISR